MRRRLTEMIAGGRDLRRVTCGRCSIQFTRPKPRGRNVLVLDYPVVPVTEVDHPRGLAGCGAVDVGDSGAVQLARMVHTDDRIAVDADDHDGVSLHGRPTELATVGERISPREFPRGMLDESRSLGVIAMEGDGRALQVVHDKRDAGAGARGQLARRGGGEAMSRTRPSTDCQSLFDVALLGAGLHTRRKKVELLARP